MLLFSPEGMGAGLAAMDHTSEVLRVCLCTFVCVSRITLWDPSSVCKIPLGDTKA